MMHTGAAECTRKELYPVFQSLYNSGQGCWVQFQLSWPPVYGPLSNTTLKNMCEKDICQTLIQDAKNYPQLPDCDLTDTNNTVIINPKHQICSKEEDDEEIMPIQKSIHSSCHQSQKHR